MFHGTHPPPPRAPPTPSRIICARHVPPALRIPDVTTPHHCRCHPLRSGVQPQAVTSTLSTDLALSGLFCFLGCTTAGYLGYSQALGEKREPAPDATSAVQPLDQNPPYCSRFIQDKQVA
ncbi:hypothetical protein NDU88_001247 [Pleurodeles waltl]|uniref:Uncharacterized protein n=1 Tax=Pleurodeles waltl TaxID=8319 RepID=A0AAV7NCV3_PLEWA|nr:hypothetical protein NDU88_001247 [Pleurodeles waltl]